MLLKLLLKGTVSVLVQQIEPHPTILQLVLFTIPRNKTCIILWTFLPCFEQWIGVAWDIIIFSILTSSMFEFILPWRFPRIFWVWLSYSTKMQKSMFFKGLTSLPQIMRKLKFIYSEKATKFCEISTLLLSYVVPVKS